MIYKNELERIISRIKEQRSAYLKELDKMPEGSLTIITKDERNYYYERFPKSGNRKKEHRVGITNNKERVLKLVRKKYLEKAVELAEENIKTLERMYKGYKPFDEVTLMRDFMVEYPEIASGVYYDAIDPAEWAKAYESPTGFYEKDLKSVFSDGTRMRSMGEMYIASRLQFYNIPYRYESPIGIPELSFIPDFTVMRPGDNKVFFWEHFGKVNDEKYMRNNAYKLSVYETYGIVPWDNLIVTYDKIGGGMNAKLIDAMIQGWLL